jgi:hypothetical protein
MLRIILKSAIVGLATSIAAVLTAFFLGGMIFAVLFRARNISGPAQEASWDLRQILIYYLGPAWTIALFSVLFLCGFAWAFRHFSRPAR